VYRLIPASADGYITDKIVEGSRSLDSNTGQAGTLDIYKLYNETEYQNQDEVFEVSRGLIKFDYSDFQDLVAVNSSSFTASIVLKNVYGGQTTPSNFILALYPLSRAFDEGRGFDVASYKDIDTANFLKCSSGINWVISGAAATGTLGENIDTIISGNLGNGIESLGSYCTFARGDEDARFNVTKIVSASIVGLLPNYGFRLSFTPEQEQDNRTRFVKRFGSRQALSKELHPKLIVEYNDRIIDSTSNPLFNVSQSFYTYNIVGGNYIDFTSASNPVVGQDCLIVELVTSKSVTYMTSSFQANFNQIIEHKTSSVYYFSQSFSGSKVNNGIYNCNFNLDLTTNTDLSSFIVDPGEVGFDLFWKSPDKTVTYARKFVKFHLVQGGFSNANEPNYIVNIINLKQQYSNDQAVRMKVFVQDRTAAVTVTRALEAAKCSVVSDMRYRIRKAYSKTVIIPFAESTRLSSDAENMYFDLFVTDLDINEVYELEFLIKNDQGKDILIANKGFTFKVVE
jgi:hypothetical protein